jgi:hypothetical protein
MKTKIITLLVLLTLHLAWGQNKPTKEEIKAAKVAEAKEKAAALLPTYSAELESVNAYIQKLNELLNKDPKSKKVSSQLLQTLKIQLDRRSELNDLIKLLETNPQEAVDESDDFSNKINVKEARYTFLNGVNFDFTENKTNYVGHFNVYVPAYRKNDSENRWGVNAGILKVNYLTRDSISTYETQNVLINPLDMPNSDGEKYNRQYNRYTSSTRVTTMSFYAQPMYKLKKIGAANFYAHLHFELLHSKFETGTKLKTIQNQEITIDATNPAPNATSLISLLEKETRNTVNLETPHFGLGATIDMNFLDDCILFFQPTFGVAFNTIDRHIYKDADGNYTLKTFDKPQAFLLIRSYFQYNTSKATQIILGTDIRGLVPNQPPYLSAYVGLNIGIDKIFE